MPDLNTVCGVIIGIGGAVNFACGWFESDKIIKKLYSIAGTTDLIFAWLLLHSK